MDIFPIILLPVGIGIGLIGGFLLCFIIRRSAIRDELKDAERYWSQVDQTKDFQDQEER